MDITVFIRSGEYTDLVFNAFIDDVIHESNDADHLCEEDCYYCEASSSSDSTSANDGTVTNNIVKECKQKKPKRWGTGLSTLCIWL